MDTESDDLQIALARIPALKGLSASDIKVARLGGLTNRNYRLDTAGGTFVLRVPGAGTSEYISRTNEAHAARVTSDIGVNAPLVFFDGTLYTDDEMIRDGVGVKTGARMGHMSVSGADGTLAAFANLDVARRVFIHINTTNPILIADTPERAAVTAAGWEVAYDGMELQV